MSSQSFADLGVSRAVSRALTELRKNGLLKFIGQTQREIMVVDPAGLAQLTDSLG